MRILAGREAALVMMAGLAACGSVPKDMGTGWSGGGDGSMTYASPMIFHPENPVQCVPFARDESGIAIRGDAWTWWDKASGRWETSDRPYVGSVIVIHGEGDGSRGHVAVVRRIINEREIVVDHANWHNQGEITIDAPVKDVSPGNDWSQVKVWWAKGQHWGRRTYAVQGFILPYQTLAAAGS